MFTGIIETLGNIQSIQQEGSNVHFTIQSSISNELRIDQSVSHDGVCLTVVSLAEGCHTVTAVQETLRRTHLSSWQVGRSINLERAMLPSSRLDGHLVQGHVDDVGKCTKIREEKGSWHFEFEFDAKHANLLVDKGSICVNGVSLTLIKPNENHFSVAIIPYTFAHTNFQSLRMGDAVNLEFDIIGKYIARSLAAYIK